MSEHLFYLQKISENWTSSLILLFFPFLILGVNTNNNNSINKITSQSTSHSLLFTGLFIIITSVIELVCTSFSGQAKQAS